MKIETQILAKTSYANYNCYIPQYRKKLWIFESSWYNIYPTYCDTFEEANKQCLIILKTLS